MIDKSSWSALLDEAIPERHMVQFFEADPEALVDNVARYIVEGLRRDEGVLVVATPEHNVAFADAVGAHAVDGRLAFLDAREIAAQLGAQGPADWDRFEATVEGAIDDLREAGAEGLRFYGEIVGVLWENGDVHGALNLEQCWEPLLERYQAMLYCGYPIDVFADGFALGEVDSLLCAHSHLLPAGAERRIDEAVDRAMREVLGERAEGLRLLIRANFRPAWAAVPHAEATILWLRNNLPGCADEILERARRYYRAG